MNAELYLCDSHRVVEGDKYHRLLDVFNSLSTYYALNAGSKYNEKK